MVCKGEAGRKEIDVAQVKEVIKVTSKLMRKAGVDVMRVIDTTPLDVFQQPLYKKGD